MMAPGPVADHRALASTKRRRDLVVVPLWKLTRRHAAAVVQLSNQIGRPHARRPIETGPKIAIEERAARRDEQLVEGAEESRVTAWKEEPVQPGPCQGGGRFDEAFPRGRNRRSRSSCVTGASVGTSVADEIPAVGKEPHVQVPGDLQER